MIDFIEVLPFLGVGIIGLLFMLKNMLTKNVHQQPKKDKLESDLYFDTRFGKKRYMDAYKVNARK